MPRKIILFLLGFVFFFSFAWAEAGLIINEIMYDPAGTDGTREWVEVFNNGGSGIDLGSYKFFEANTNHTLTFVQGDATLSAGSYAIIVNDPTAFLTDWPGFSGTIFDSSFSLNNTGEALVFKDGSGAIVDQYTYSSTLGGSDNGSSLQLISGSWSGNMPTPGTENQLVAVEEEEEDSGSGGGTSTTVSGSSSSKSKTKIFAAPTPPKPKVTITAPKMIFSNRPFEFKGEANIQGGRYFWNFGDGNSKETKNPRSFLYTYFYEGEYVVTLEYYEKNSSTKPDAVAKITLKVVPLEILISRVGDATDFFVEISNKTSYEMDISGWSLSSINTNFLFPRNSIILPKKTITLSSKITGFNLSDQSTLKLSNQAGELVYQYSDGGVAPATPALEEDGDQDSNATDELSAQDELEPGPVTAPAEFLPDLSAAAISSVEKVEGSSLKRTLIYALALFVFVGASSGGVYFIRRPKISPPQGEDFELLE